MREPIDRRVFLAGAGAALTSAALGRQGGEVPTLLQGPFACHYAPSRACYWARASAAGTYELELEARGGTARVLRALAIAHPAQDMTLHWEIGLPSREAYSFTVRVRHGERVLYTTENVAPWNMMFPEMPQGSVVLGSCADERKFPDQPVWDRMREANPDLVVLLGDTPYVDSTDLAVQRERYRAFYAQPQLAALLRKSPFVATWDDHDYGTNDEWGEVAGRAASRQAFLENHGGGEWGSGKNGIFTKRRVGAMEIFLLDTRWFADAEPSPFDAAKKTLLGAEQWHWLQEGLKSSTAPIKVLASGMVWNDAVRPGKNDYWGHWAHEREGLFRWLGEEQIGGVVLVSGDVHRTRVVRHATMDVVGYELIELVTSPLANTVIDDANVAHPGLLFDAGVEQTFLKLRTSPSTGTTLLRAELLDGKGELLYWLERSATYLSRRN